MLHLTDLVQILAVIVIVIIMAMVLRARHRGKAAHDLQYAHDNVCAH
jgi:hypothetical protein